MLNLLKHFTEGHFQHKKGIFNIRRAHLFTHRDYSPSGRARLKLVAGGSVSAGQSSQKSQHDGQSRLPSWIQPFIWILMERTCPVRLHKYEVSWTQTFRPWGEQETFKEEKHISSVRFYYVCLFVQLQEITFKFTKNTGYETQFGRWAYL